jgi:peptide/nickel transport system ATP-binding protein
MSSETATPLLKVDQVYKAFQVGSEGWLGNKPILVHAINGVSITINKGESFCLVGESGCGKSTLARTVMGLETPTSGSITYEDQRIDDLADDKRLPFRRRMQMIFQNPYASLNPRMTVNQTLEEPLRFHRPDLGAVELRDKVVEVMESVGNNPDWGERFPHEFSGGQRQRISIARALMVDPEFVVADEPISALDVSIQAQVLNVMMEAQEKHNLTYLFITHDLSVVEHFGSRVGVMYLGALCELADTKTLFSSPRHPYTQGLLAAIPKMDGSELSHTKMTGEVPTAMNLPSGCVFHSRCPLAKDRCKTDIPELREIAGRQVACHFAEETA